MWKKSLRYLIHKREKVGLDHFNDPKAFTKQSYDIKMFTKTFKNTI